MKYFKKKKRYLFLRFALLLIILGIGGFFFFNHFKKAQAEWFDANWFYRKAINITNSGTAQTDYQVSITVDTATLITANKLQPDCDDIRITDINGKLLPHWIEAGINGCNTSSTNIWTKVPSIPTSGQAVYLYYGNPNATSVQNGNNVFLFFDDFNDGNIADWTSDGNWQIDTSDYSLKSLITTDAYIGKAFSNSDYIFEFRAKTLSSSSDPNAWFGFRKNSALGVYNSSNLFSGLSGWGSEYSFWNGATNYVTGSGSSIVPNQWYNMRIVAHGANVELYNLDISSSTPRISGTTSILSGNYIGFRTNIVQGKFDDIRVRKYAATAPTAANATEEKSPAPVAYWKFDEGTGTTTYDDSSNNNDGTVSSATWQTEDMCISGKCLKFDGTDDYVNIGAAKFDAITEATIETWFKYTGTFDQNRVFFSRYKDSSNRMPIFISSSSQKITYENIVGGSNRNITSDSTITAGKWYHAAFTCGAGGMKMYVDGVLQSSTNATTDCFSSISATASNSIGTHASSAYFNGFIDDVKIYPYARTASQVKADYNAGKSGAGGSAKSASMGNKTQDWMSNGLVGYWKMDEVTGSGSTLADSSGSGYTGTAKLYGGGNTATDSAHVVGKFGNGFSFDGGDDYLDFGNILTTDRTNSRTYSVWVNPSAQNYNTIFSLGNLSSYKAGWSAFTIISSSQIRVGYDLESPYYVSLNCSTDLNQWNYLTFVIDVSNPVTTTIKIYKNGVYCDQTTQTRVTASRVNTSFLIGAETTGYPTATRRYFFKGYMDDFRIYSRALSPKEVSDLYNWAPGPVGWWKMDDSVSGNSKTIVDSSGYGNNGTTYYGANTTGMNCKIIGKFGGGCLFDGTDDYISAGSGASLNLANTGTVEAWIKINSYAGTNEYPGIVTKGAAAGWDSPGYGINVFTNADIQGTIDDTVSYKTISFGKPSVGAWHHLVFSWDGSYLRAYVDGSQYGSSIAQGTTNAGITADSLFIGRRHKYFNGSIDNVRIYNYARSAKQILEDMNAGHPSVGSPVGSYAGYWKFDEGYGTTAKDQSINGNNGTISNAVWTNDGKFGKALNFKGVSDSYVNAGDNESLDMGLSDFTISAWIRTSSAGTGYGRIVDKNYSTGYMMAISNSYGNNGNLCMSIGGLYTQGRSGSKNLRDNKWHHVVVVFNRTGNAVYYVDGSVDGATTDISSKSSTNLDNSSNLKIGSDGTGDAYFAGSIDEVKIYKFALTADDIRAEYNQGKAIVMGSVSNTSGLAGGSVASNSASAAYCIPGDTATCNAPVGEWKMDDYSGTTANDTSGNGNTGTLGGGTSGYMPTWKSSGSCHSGSCLKFDGTDDYVDAGNNTNLNITSTITMEAWIKPETQAVNHQSVLEKWSSYILWHMEGSNPSCYINDGGWHGVTLSQSYSYYSNNWWHVACTYDSPTGIMKVYVNGKLDNQGTADTTIASNTNHTTVGKGAESSTSFKGFVDDAKIFNYVRTPAQIAWDYNRGKPVGWWKFDECQGSTAYDESSNNNDGTITIGATGTQDGIGTCTDGDTTNAWYNGRSGKYNSALSFDGTDDWVNLGKNSSLTSITNALTASAWVYPHVLAGSSSWQNAVSQYGDGSNSWILRTSDSNNGHFVPYVNVSSSWYACDGGLLPLNQWSHILLTYDGETLKGYVNGKYVCQNTSPSGSLAITGSTVVGGNYSGERFDGLIDEVKIFNYVLTAEQMKLEYNQGAAVRFAPITGKP